jgi:hypothetical protein
MPYYLDVDTHEEERVGDGQLSWYKYVEPWHVNTAMLPFPDSPAPEPEAPLDNVDTRGMKARERFDAWRENDRKRFAHALWKVSGLTATCRALGVKRVFGRYDGGGDEGFTYFRGIEMSDGRMISKELLRNEAAGLPCDELIENAVAALMGNFDAGEFSMYGVVTIDFDACTITDEKNRDVVCAAHEGKKRGQA